MRGSCIEPLDWRRGREGRDVHPGGWRSKPGGGDGGGGNPGEGYEFGGKEGNTIRGKPGGGGGGGGRKFGGNGGVCG